MQQCKILRNCERRKRGRISKEQMQPLENSYIVDILIYIIIFNVDYLQIEIKKQIQSIKI